LVSVRPAYVTKKFLHLRSPSTACLSFYKLIPPFFQPVREIFTRFPLAAFAFSLACFLFFLKNNATVNARDHGNAFAFVMSVIDRS